MIYLVVFMPILVGGGLGIICILMYAFARFKGVQPSQIPNLNGMLITLPAFFLWMPAGFLFGNLVLYSFGPLRRVAERYVDRTGRPGFIESQQGLLRMLCIMGMICLPLIALGFVL